MYLILKLSAMRFAERWTAILVQAGLMAEKLPVRVVPVASSTP